MQDNIGYISVSIQPSISYANMIHYQTSLVMTIQPQCVSYYNHEVQPSRQAAKVQPPDNKTDMIVVSMR